VNALPGQPSSQGASERNRGVNTDVIYAKCRRPGARRSKSGSNGSIIIKKSDKGVVGFLLTSKRKQ